MARLAALIALTHLMAVSGASAAQKAVVFPFDLSLQQKEDDFFIGPSKPNVDEERRLKAVYDELVALLGKDPRYTLIDPAPIAADITAAKPFTSCNGCEIDLTKKLGGELAFTGLVDKASDTLLNMQIGILDIASGKLQKTVSVVIQGNTDESWIRAVRWLHKNRLAAEAEQK